MEKLKDFRKKQKLSQKELASMIGCSLSWYQKVETGKQQPGKKFIRNFLKKFPKFDYKYFYDQTLRKE